MATTIFRLAEEISKILNQGFIQEATSTSMNEIKISICQVTNNLLKVDYFSTNVKMGEAIDNGSVLGLYESIECSSWNGRSKATLPIKPLKMPRNMGVFAIYPKYQTNGVYELDKEFIPLQMGQSALLKSQPLLNNLLGQVGYEVFGNDVIFTKDIKSLFPEITLAMRLAILDFSQYDDWDILPILPEHEFQIKQEVVKMYSQVGIADMVVDPTSKQLQNQPTQQQKQPK